MFSGYQNSSSGSLTKFSDTFGDEKIRKNFIRKVYSILCVQLLVTLGIVTPFVYIDEVRMFSHHNPWMWYLALVMTFVTLIILACCPDVRRNYPINIILLAIFTVCEGFLLGTLGSHYNTEAVVMAVGVTAVVCLGLTLFAFQTKWDFTMYGGILFVGFIVVFCFGILCLFIQSRIAHLAYGCLGALLFSAYLVFDTQMMMGGKHQYSLSPEEHIFAALNLYLDIVNLFMFILTLIGGSSD